MNLKSAAFSENTVIPKDYTGEGSDKSPPLEWDLVPPATKELALVCDDPDAPTPEPWVHWVIYKIPPNMRKIREGILPTEKVGELDGALQGKNSWGKIGYNGPMPPKGHGLHRYIFTLYAVDINLKLKGGVSKRELEQAMKGHIISKTSLTGKYKRE